MIVQETKGSRNRASGTKLNTFLERKIMTTFDEPAEKRNGCFRLTLPWVGGHIGKSGVLVVEQTIPGVSSSQ